MLRLSSAVVAVRALVETADLGELASTTCMQRDDVLALVVDPLDDVNLPDWVLVKVVRPAATNVSSSCPVKTSKDWNSQ